MEPINEKTDIRNREDLTLIIHHFYAQAKLDPVIGIYFTEVVPINWETHTPLIISFWETLLFGKGGYQGSVMEKHLNVNHLKRIGPEEFQRWLLLWENTIRHFFEGPKAEEAISRAKNIANIMQIQLQ